MRTANTANQKSSWIDVSFAKIVAYLLFQHTRLLGKERGLASRFHQPFAFFLQNQCLGGKLAQLYDIDVIHGE